MALYKNGHSTIIKKLFYLCGGNKLLRWRTGRASRERNLPDSIITHRGRFYMATIKSIIEDAKNDRQFANDRMRWVSNFKGFILFLFRLVIIVGICYVILGDRKSVV